MSFQLANDQRVGAEIYHGSEICKHKSMEFLTEVGILKILLPLNMGMWGKHALCGWSIRRWLSTSSRRLGKWSNMVHRSVPMSSNTRWRRWFKWRARDCSSGLSSFWCPLMIHLVERFTSRALLGLGNPSLPVPLKLRRMTRSNIGGLWLWWFGSFLFGFLCVGKQTLT